MSSTSISILNHLRQTLSASVRTPRYNRLLKNLTLVSATPGQCTFEIKLAEEHTNRNGTLHGAFTALLVDETTTLALLSNDGGVTGVSIDMSISYMRSAKPGEELTVEAHTEKYGRTVAYLTAYIKLKESGKLVARASHTKYVS